MVVSTYFSVDQEVTPAIARNFARTVFPKATLVTGSHDGWPSIACSVGYAGVAYYRTRIIVYGPYSMISHVDEQLIAAFFRREQQNPRILVPLRRTVTESDIAVARQWLRQEGAHGFTVDGIGEAIHICLSPNDARYFQRDLVIREIQEAIRTSQHSSTELVVSLASLPADHMFVGMKDAMLFRTRILEPNGFIADGRPDSRIVRSRTIHKGQVELLTRTFTKGDVRLTLSVSAFSPMHLELARSIADVTSPTSKEVLLSACLRAKGVRTSGTLDMLLEELKPVLTTGRAIRLTLQGPAEAVEREYAKLSSLVPSFVESLPALRVPKEITEDPKPVVRDLRTLRTGGLRAELPQKRRFRS